MFVLEDFRPKLRTPQPNWHDVFLYGDWSKVVDTPGYLLVVRKFLCSVTSNMLYLYTRGILVQSSGHSSHSGNQMYSSFSFRYVRARPTWIYNMLVKYMYCFTSTLKMDVFLQDSTRTDCTSGRR